MRFADRVIWITGASSGIGEGLAGAFHREGARLILSARREDQLERVKAACTGAGEILIAPFDVTDDAARVAAVDDVLKHFGRIDMLVNNAGISQRSLGRDTALAVDRRVMEIDYFAVIALTKLVLPSMLARKSGHLVVTSSVAGKFGVWHRTAYSAAKHALHGFFDTLRIELHRENIAVSLLVVAGVQTDISLKAITGDGSSFGRMDPTQSEGISIESCARIVLDGLAGKRHEINVVSRQGRLALWLARFWPAELYRRMTKWRGQSVLTRLLRRE